MSTVLFDTDGEVVVVTINRPEVRNAVDDPTAAALVEAFRRFDADEALAVAVLTGASGPFCARADLTAVELAHQLAQFPQRCLRADRLSAYEQWAMPFEQAMRNEFRRGADVIRSGETLAGAARFAAGAGRHGSFETGKQR